MPLLGGWTSRPNEESTWTGTEAVPYLNKIDGVFLVRILSGAGLFPFLFSSRLVFLSDPVFSRPQVLISLFFRPL